MPDRSDPKMKIFTPPVRRSHVLPGAAAALILLLGWWIYSARTPAKPVQSDSTRLITVPSTESQSQAATLPSENADVAKPEVRAVFENEQYRVRVDKVFRHEREAEPGKMSVHLRCTLEDKTRNPDLAATFSRAQPLRTSVGSISNEKFDAISGALNTSIQKSSKAQFEIELRLPNTARVIESIEAGLLLLFAAEREKISWEQPGNFNRPAHKLKSFEFKLADFKKSGDEVEATLQITAPQANPLEPAGWPNLLIQTRLLASDGKYLYGVGSGGPTQRVERFRTGALEAKSYEVAFVSRVSQERFDFRFENIEIPAPSLVQADVEAKVRGAKKLEAGGFSFELQRVEFKRNGAADGRCEISIFFTPPKTKSVAAVGWWLLDVYAEDDTGARLKSLEVAFVPHRIGSKGGWVSVWLPLPKNDADRLVKLSGKFHACIIDEAESATFPLTGNESPLVSGPVRLAKLTHEPNATLVEWDIATNVLPVLWGADSVTCELQDKNGRILKLTKGGVNQIFGAKDRLGMSLRTDPAAKLIVRYPTKWHIENIPIEFLNVGFPRQVGTSNDGMGF